MISEVAQRPNVRRADSHWVIAFSAMASPCEVLVRCETAGEADYLASLALQETRRIEQKFSRYRNDNLVYRINQSNGRPVQVDDETAQLLQYSGQAYEISNGLFDITSGILRRAWVFNGQEAQPDQNMIESLLELVGWDKVRFDGAQVQLRPGMQIDFGGVGKEYAVDRVARLLFEASGKPLLVNFGGDIRAVGDSPMDIPWAIGIENPSGEGKPVGLIEIVHGAVATSGDSRRYCYVNGVRLGHILDPRTGWPVLYPPRSVTVLADFCMEAGLLTTLAILHGKDAEEFLAAQNVEHRCLR